jgi:hypothetical protein
MRLVVSFTTLAIVVRKSSTDPRESRPLPMPFALGDGQDRIAALFGRVQLLK